MSNRIRTPQRERSQTYDRTVASSRSQPALRRRSRRLFDVNLPALQIAGLQSNWRWVSGGLVLALGIALAIITTSQTFFVTSVEVGGLRTVPAEEIFALSGVAGYHIFRVDPEQVSEAVVTSPSIATASARVYWPSRVVVIVKEREPALVWEQQGVRYWVDVRGNLMQQRQDLPNLIRVLSEGQAVPVGCPGPDCPDEVAARIAIQRDVVEGALQLKTLHPEIELLYYDPVAGLSYDDDRGWRVRVGVGTDMSRKLLIYETIVANLQAQGLLADFIDVSNPEAPFYRLRVIPG